MAVVACRECGKEVSEEARLCPHCGVPFPWKTDWNGTGYEWKSSWTYLGIPVIHIAYGRNKYGKLRVAKGIIAIGQFGIGLITIAQFGIGFLFGFGQFLAGLVTLAQFSAGLYIALGQFAIGHIAVGQIAYGNWVLAQIGAGKHVWSVAAKDPLAIEFFKPLISRFGF